MKIQVRQSVFETNSSSTHSLSLFEKSDWERFKKGEMVLENYPEDPKLVDINSVNPEEIYNHDNDHGDYEYEGLYYKYEDFEDVECFQNIFEETDNKVIMSTYGEWF